ncbi:MAG TPA: mannosyltransferase family protein [Vicinamibacterales bacterium]|nr:mannosyltransferase family protein [Vicinamibacterales bacterium]
MRALLDRLRRSDVLWIVTGSLALRLLTAGLAFLVNALFPLARREQFTVFPSTHLFWDTFARYDSGWYFGIARYGYEWVEGGRSNVAFFPLYPLLVRQVALALGGGRSRIYMAGILVSWTAFVLAMVLLYRLARLHLPPEQARRAVVYAALFPFAFFFGVVYPESLFLLLTLAAFLAFHTRHWLAGGLAGALATATRPNGVFMVPALAVVAWRAARGSGARLAPALGVLLSLAGVAAYSLYVYTLSGSLLEWRHAMQRWQWHPATHPPWTPIARLLTELWTRPYAFLTSGPTAVADLLNGTAALALALSVPFIWIRLGAGYALLVLLNLAVPLSSGVLEGLGRYCAVLFPFAIWLASFRSPGLHTALVAVYGMLYLLCLTMFTKLYPLF